MEYSDISILVPSLSRPLILLKKLKYYLKLKATFNICICDSSPKVDEQFKKEMNKISEQLNIKYFHKPGLNDREAIFFLIKNCQTKYSAFIADDDFFIPQGLYECASYLKKNKDCRVAYGKAINVDHKSLNKVNNRIYASNYWGKRSFLQNNKIDRLNDFSENYIPNFFGMHRTNEFLQDYDGSQNSPSKSLGELIINYVTLAKGKAEFIPIAYLIRQSHPSRYLVPQGIEDRLIDDKLGESIPVFISTLSKALISEDISIKEAENISKKYLKKILNELIKYSDDKYLFQKINSFFQKAYKRIFNSIKDRLFRKSSYFSDFVYYIKLISEIT